MINKTITSGGGPLHTPHPVTQPPNQNLAITSHMKEQGDRRERAVITPKSLMVSGGPEGEGAGLVVHDAHGVCWWEGTGFMVLGPLGST